MRLNRGAPAFIASTADGTARVVSVEGQPVHGGGGGGYTRVIFESRDGYVVEVQAHPITGRFDIAVTEPDGRETAVALREGASGQGTLPLRDARASHNAMDAQPRAGLDGRARDRPDRAA